MIGLPTEEVMTRGDNLGPNLEPRLEVTGKLFRGGKFKRDPECYKTEGRKPWQNMPMCTVLKERNK